MHVNRFYSVTLKLSRTAAATPPITATISTAHLAESAVPSAESAVLPESTVTVLVVDTARNKNACMAYMGINHMQLYIII